MNFDSLQMRGARAQGELVCVSGHERKAGNDVLMNSQEKEQQHHSPSQRLSVVYQVQVLTIQGLFEDNVCHLCQEDKEMADHLICDLFGFFNLQRPELWRKLCAYLFIITKT